MSKRRVRLSLRRGTRRTASRMLFFEVMEPRLVLSPMFFDVTNTSDSGAGSLRQAIIDANTNPGPDNIQFDIPASTAPLLNVPVPGFDPGSQTWTIKLASTLPAITDQVNVEGYSQAHFAVPYRYPSAFTSAIQEFNVSAIPSGGSFTLSTVAPLPVATTPAIPFNAPGGTIQTDLEAILGQGNVTVQGSAEGFFVFFKGIYTGEAIPDLVVSSNLTQTQNADLTDSLNIPNGTAQQISAFASAVPTGGTFTLTTTAPLPVGTTPAIPFDASTTTIQDDLDAILGPGSVTVSGTTSNFSVSFMGAYAGQQISPLIPTSSLTQTAPVDLNELTSTLGGVLNGAPTQITSKTNSIAALDGNNSQPVVILDGSATGGATGFDIEASHSLIDGFIIDGFGVGVSIPSPDNVGDLVQGNFIGQYFLSQYDPETGMLLTAPSSQIFTGHGNSLQGVLLGSTNATIGGVEDQDNNVITGNGHEGVSILPGAVGNQILGNQIGIAGPSLEGLFAIAPNGADGVLITSDSNLAASSNVVGGATDGAGNLISSNLGNGIHIVGAGSTENLIEENFIGIGPGGGFIFGQGEPGNSGDGILIENAPGNTIGGTNIAQRNIISANLGKGVEITGATATANALLNNFIGLDAAGNSVFGNADEGVAIFSAANIVGPGNVISGNLRGVLISGPNATGNQVNGNLIGTDSTGQADLGNAREGVLIQNAAGNVVLGNGAGSQVISGNNGGVSIVGATAAGNVIQGNLIGTNVTGTLVLGNSLSGILIDSAPGTTVGGTLATMRNLISGNNYGVTINGATATSNLVEGNFIGTDITGLLALPNENDGVLFSANASNNQIGGLPTGAANTIAFNFGNGVNVQSGVADSILSNLIFGNGLQGISIVGDSFTSVAPGPNNLQSFPDLTSLIVNATSTDIRGTLTSTKNTTFLIQFFAISAPSATSAGGAALLGSAIVVTDNNGVAQIQTTVLTAVSTGTSVVATATKLSPANLATFDTSAFSPSLSGGQVSVGFIVTNTSDTGPGSLRQAILDSNATPNASPSIPNEVVFAISGVGPFLIHLLSPLPTITNPVDINGYSEPGSSLNKTFAGFDELETDVAVLMIQVDGSSAGPGADGLKIATVGCDVSGLIITGFSGAGIELVPGPAANASAIGDSIFGNFIGVNSFDTHGSSLVPRGGNLLANGVGIAISSSNNRIGGTLPPSRNVIQGNNGVGVSISGPTGTGNLVEGDYILDNSSDGILITTSNNYIGEVIGQGPGGAGDIISGNGANGVHIVGSAAQGNIIVNNEIGTDVGIAGSITPTRGLKPRPNLNDGILIEDAPGNTVGGLLANSFNVIAANGFDGVNIQNGASQSATDNQVLGNHIGYNLRGVISRMPNRDGINISSADNTVGGTAAAAQNIIINNRRNGITISSMFLDPGNHETGLIPNSDPIGNVVEANFIGTQGGADNFGNALEGVLIDAAANNTIGSTTGAAPNVISANNDGIVIRNPASVGNLVAGNLIGTMSDGATVLGNAVDGVEVDNAPSNTIGGTTSAAANVISGNNWGVVLSGATATGNQVQGNFIGTNSSGDSIRNAKDGVLITMGASNNAIGGTAAGAQAAATDPAGNTIADNVGNGINVLSGTSNTILSNSIVNNNLLGIDLGGDGVTPNHPNDGQGPNDLQAYPVVTAVSASGGSTSVQATLQSLPNTTFLVQFFSNTATTRSGFGPGQTPLGAMTVTTDGSGNAAIATTFSAVVPKGVLVTATATNLTSGDTSEFSQAVSSIPVAVRFTAASYSVGQADGSITLDVQRSGNLGSVVTVAYVASGGTAVAGTNYTATMGSLTFNPGDTDKTFVIPIIDTKMVGTNVTVNLTLSDPTGGATIGGQNPVTLTIQNNNQLTMQFTTAAYTVSESAASTVITVNRNSSASTSEVTYATGGGTAVGGTNYTPVSGILVFNPGQTTQTFSIPIFHDLQVTGPLTVGLALSGATGGFLGPVSDATLTINNVDAPGALQFSATKQTVSATAGTASVTVLRQGGAGGTVSVMLATGGGSAVPATDYTPVSQLVTFNPGQTSQTVTIPVLNSMSGNSASFGVVLSSPGGGATLGTASTLTITIVPPGSIHSQSNNPGSAGTNNGAAPNAVGPAITDMHLLGNAGAITAIVLNFDRALDTARAQDVANYGNVIRTTGADGVFGTFDDGLVAIASAVYNPANNSVTLSPAAPIPTNTLYQIAINQNANPLTGAGVADTTGALLEDDGTGGPVVFQFGLGTKLSYIDAGGNAVSLALSGGGQVGSSRVDLQACKLEYSIVSPK